MLTKTNTIRGEAAALGLIGALALAGCSGSAPEGNTQDENRGNDNTHAIERIIEDAAAQEGQDLDLDLDAGGKLPEGFPDDVPVIDGRIDQSTRISLGEGTSWMVEFEVDDPDAGFDEAEQLLLDAGFESTAEIDTDGAKMRYFAKGDLQVYLAFNPGDHTPSVMYNVTQAASE